MCVCERVFQENLHVCANLCLQLPLDIRARDGCCCVSTRPRDSAGALVCIFSCYESAQARHISEGETGKVACSTLQMCEIDRSLAEFCMHNPTSAHVMSSVVLDALMSDTCTNEQQKASRTVQPCL